MKVTAIAIGAAVALVGIAACGSTTTPSVPPSTPTPASSPTPTPSATPVQTVPPTLPLALFSTKNGLEVVNDQGVVQWGLTTTQMETMVDQNPKLDSGPFQLDTNNANPVPAGPNIFIVGLPNASTPPPIVVVLSSAGKTLGSGPVSGPTPDFGLVVSSPNGTEWAWNVTLGKNKAGQYFGAVEIAGIGVPTHTIYKWTAPVGATEAVNYWTDAGIILQRTGSNTTCTQYYSLNNAAFIINPITGSLSDLFSGNQQFIYATSEVKVAGLYSNPNAVSINGTVYSEAGPFVVTGANVSPGGGHVVVNRENFLGQCGGNVPIDSALLVDVDTHSQIALPKLWESGWLNSSEFIAASNMAYNLQGKPVNEIAPAAWHYLGSVSG